MLKKRIIASLVVKDGIVVQSIGFNKYLPVGKPEIAVEFLNNWGVDEIVLLDISATRQGKFPDVDLIKRVAKKCFVPLAIGGGVKSVLDVRNLTQSGADKIVLNSIIYEQPEVVTEIGTYFGSQCVICSVDIKKDKDGNPKVYKHNTKELLNLDPHEFLLSLEHLGAGEILLNFVDRDGFYNGFDIENIQALSKDITIPVIVQGGAKNASSFKELFDKTQINAAAAANFFHFSEHSINVTKSQLSKDFDLIRLESNCNYSDSSIDSNGRLLKLDETVLENLLYTKVDPEII